MNRWQRWAGKWRVMDAPAALSGLGGYIAVMLPVAAGFAWGLPLGFGAWLEIPVVLVLMLLALLLSAYLLAGIMSVIPLALPRLTISTAAIGTSAAAVGFHEADMTWRLAIGISLLLSVIGLGTGIVAYRFMRGRHRTRSRISMIVTVCLWFVMTSWLLEAWPKEQPVYEQYAALYEDAPMPTAVRAEYPGSAGAYDSLYFTYGSGQDRFRSEYAADADLLAEPADASTVTDHWTAYRSWFWQTEITELPLNGRVWMPKGEGPYPLVLIVHGNHLMEEFSDAGYTYLGKHLASRGFIAVSIDENFANYSVWSQSQDQNMFLREWGLVEHLRAIEQFHLTAGNPFSNKVDLERISLIGHSRGGQAVVMAADEGYDIQSIIAIAPTDWRINDKYLRLRNINYLVLQGSQDGDISTFDGDRQYRRITLSEGGRTDEDYRFKSAVYIVGANHGQFNTDWGDRDTARPTHMLLNHTNLLPEAAQRQAALVYVTAFLESTLHDNREYLPLFQDWRTAMNWLPPTGYVTQFMDSSFVVLEDYEAVSRGIPGVTSVAEALSASEQEQVLDRRGNSKHNRGVELSWNESGGKYTLQLHHDRTQSVNSEDVLAFAVATMPLSDTELQADLPDVTVEVTSLDGEVNRLALSEMIQLSPPVLTTFTQHRWLEQDIKPGRYSHPFEPVFQSVRIPLSEFEGWLPSGEHAQLKAITWIIDADKPGRMLLDDVGIFPAPS